MPSHVMHAGVSILVALLCVACGGRGPSQRVASGNVDAMLSSDSMQRVEFAERVFDFGTLREEDGIVSHRFVFRNRSERPVVVTCAQTTCQCIRTYFSHAPVPPGDEGTVTVSYDPSYRPGVFSKEIRILFDGVRKLRHVWIRGEVIPCRHPITEDYPYDLGHGLRANLNTLSLGGMFPGGERSVLFRYGNDSGKSMRLRFRVEGATREALVIPDTAVLAADERREMRLVYRMPEGLLGVQRLSVVPEVNGTVLPALMLTAVALPPKATVTAHSPKVNCAQNGFLFEQTTASQSFEVSLENGGGSALRILSVDIPPEVATDLRPGVEIAPGQSRTFASTLRLPSASKGFHDRMYIVANDPVRPYITINLNTIPEKQTGKE